MVRQLLPSPPLRVCEDVDMVLHPNQVQGEKSCPSIRASTNNSPSSRSSKLINLTAALARARRNAYVAWEEPAEDIVLWEEAIVFFFSA